MQALILAGGLGTRLRSVVADRPKSMAAVGDLPFLAFQIEHLRRHGVDHVVLCVGYMHEQVRDHFGDGSAVGVRIDYSVEDRPLGTGGAVKHAERFVHGPFLLLNGDTWFDVDLCDLARAHDRHAARDPRCIGTIVLAEVDDARAFGTVRVDADLRVTAFLEKTDAAGTNLVNAGIYMLSPDVMKCVSAGATASLEREVFPALVLGGRTLFGHPAAGFFIDIGTPAGYAAFIDHIRAQGVVPHDHPQQSAATP